MIQTAFFASLFVARSLVYFVQSEPTCLSKDKNGASAGVETGEQCLDLRRLGETDLEEAVVNLWTSDHTSCNTTGQPQDFLLFSVATEENDGYKRFIRSTSIYNVPTKVLGLGERWEVGNAGGLKLMQYKKALQPFVQNKDMIVMLVDGYDTVLLGTIDALLERFRAMDARVVFSTETTCWPDKTLADQYPATELRNKFLDAGALIGYANDLYKLISMKEVKNEDDDQLYFTKLFLDKDLREQYQMKLDYNNEIFQSLSVGLDDEVTIVDDAVVNKVHNTKPLVLHGNGYSKIKFNRLTDYVPKAWTKSKGCISCWEDNIDLSKISESNYPMVLIALYVGIPTPFLREFFDLVLHLDYPKNRIHLFVFNSVEYHDKDVLQFVDNVQALEAYQGVKLVRPEDGMTEAAAKSFASEYCLAKDCDYLLVLDSIARLDNPNSLKDLISLNRKVIAPMLVRPGKAWSNFWGDLTKDGFYARSFDYMDIVNNEKRGIWNVPYISAAILMNATLLHHSKPVYEVEKLDPDMAFCHHYRNLESETFMYVSNIKDYGHLVNPENYNTNRVHPEMFELLYNKLEWERRYISPEYEENLNPNKTSKQPCPDVYWFPVTTPEFAQNLIDIMEGFGQWSDGSNYDERVVGGYENVPTRDIHMNQVGYEQTWMEFLRVYVRPLQEHVFLGYYNDDPRIEGGYENVPTRDIHMKQVGLHDTWLYFLEKYVKPMKERFYFEFDPRPPRALLNFVVRYRPDEQPSLMPHHDTSTYTINLALNRHDIDYQGGGCRFIRYNCSVVDTRVGWMLMHPGRLTHYHEGLPVTNGTRYIMISFVDP